MHYSATMMRLLSLDPSGIRQVSLNHLPWICLCHVSVLGLIYGGTAAWLSREMLPGQGLLKLTLAGIPAAFLMHAGATLFIWVFLKAMGGKATFLTTYFSSVSPPYPCGRYPRSWLYFRSRPPALSF